MRSHSAGILRDPALDVHNQPRRPEPASVGKITHHRKTAGLLSAASVCYDYKCRRGEVSERLKELASKASVGETLPWVQIPPSPPFPSPSHTRWIRSRIWSTLPDSPVPGVALTRLVSDCPLL